MNGPWSPEAGDFIMENGIREIELNQSKGWCGDNVDFLRELPALEAFTIIDFSINNIAGVQAQTTLKYLDLNTYANTAVDFTLFNVLEDCSVEWNRRFHGFFELPNLRKAFINKLPDSDFGRLASLTSLSHLSLASPGIETLQGLQHLYGLVFLGVYEGRKLRSLSGIEALKAIETLEINGCKKISDIRPLLGMTSLRRLMLCNDGNIESFMPLANLENLEELRFYESTNVLDGNLGVLKMIRSLKHISFMEREHYTHRRSDFMP